MKMELNEIQDLIKFVAKSGVSEVELESKGFKIVIKTNPPQKSGKGAEPAMMQSMPMQMQQPLPSMAAPQAQAPAVTPAGIESQPSTGTDESKYITVKSPMIGTFYRSSGPDKPPFVGVGDEIKPGKPVCIIEAMKLFNEIESEVSGKIVKVLVDDSTPVEYDQPLFLVDPS